MSDRKLDDDFKDKEYRDEYVASRVRGAIALQVQALRTQSGLTQIEFSHKVGKTQSVISRLESTEYGRVTIQTLIDLACAMDIALIVKFVSHDKFLEVLGAEALRPDALRVDTYDEMIGKRDQHSLARASQNAQSQFMADPQWVRHSQQVQKNADRGVAMLRTARAEAYSHTDRPRSSVLQRAISQ